MNDRPFKKEFAIANTLYEIVFDNDETQYDFEGVVPQDIINVLNKYYNDEINGEWIWTAVREGDWECTIYISAINDIKIKVYCDLWKGLISMERDG